MGDTFGESQGIRLLDWLAQNDNRMKITNLRVQSLNKNKRILKQALFLWRFVFNLLLVHKTALRWDKLKQKPCFLNRDFLRRKICFLCGNEETAQGLQAVCHLEGWFTHTVAHILFYLIQKTAQDISTRYTSLQMLLLLTLHVRVRSMKLCIFVNRSCKSI